MIWSWWMLLYLALAAVPLFFLWSTLHEVSHYLGIRAQIPIKKVKFWLYPHKRKEDGAFFFARVRWHYTHVVPTDNQTAWALFAPRWMNLLAVLLFPLATLFGSWGAIIWMSIWGAGLIDAFNGSLGTTERSDMQRYAKTWGISPWVFRIVGITLILTSAALGVTLLLLF